MAVQFFAHDFAMGVLDYEAVTDHFCEDCSLAHQCHGCPLDGDYYDRECPRHNDVVSLVEELEGVLNSYNIY